MKTTEDTPKTIDTLKVPQKGEILEGTVIAQDGLSFFVDLGPCKVGIIFGLEYQKARSILKNLKAGDKISAKVKEAENDEGYVELSLKEAMEETTWENVKILKEAQEVFKVKISKVNKGGLITEISGIPAFLPTSQLSPVNFPKVPQGDKTEILKKLQLFIGKELMVKVLDYDERAGQIILTEQSQEGENIQKAIQELKVGDVVEGTISGIVDFGAFVKFSQPETEAEETDQASLLLEGLVHISELDWQLIEDPNQVIKIGQKVKAKIIDIAQGRVSLSLKALKTDPWQELELKTGDEVKGKIVKFNPFGAFVQLVLPQKESQPKIQGLIHISEFGTEEKMKEALEIDKEYNFQLLSFQPQRHWMSLRLK
ncbi:MAG: S1 RNA-binding domain-containing protein [Candidatus Paceibacterota bacterium]|jgi:small subunit ribosomal protein S1|nr:S1 RNA-binding domain-containing protein [Candidatus Paceibacterota bacterium]MDD4830669.1 S1 RNA-binding domain-containing protein [Candidatus Paceibacterota bacterium]MDD4875251.1 S1 RNA-binding domain-containing protein [Candidatus Paceibacterota bacterium]